MSGTIKQSDVAKAAKVARSAVSMYLNDYPGLSKQTREKIATAIKDLGYQPDDMARSIKTGKSRVIAFVYNHMPEQLFNGINHAARENDFLIKSFLFPEEISVADADALFKTFQVQRIAGAIFHHNHKNMRHVKEKLFKAGIPQITTCPSEFAGNALIASNEKMGTGLVAEYLLGMGHRDFAYLGILPDDQASSVRFANFSEALKKQNISIDEKNVIIAENKSDRIRKLRKMLSSPRRPTAMFCASDIMAIAALSVAASLGLKVPEDISLTGYGDNYIADCITPALTTIAEKHYEMGEHTCSKLIRIMRKQIPHKFEELFDVELVIRDSVKKL